MKPLQIDIDEVFQKKNPKLYRWIPRIVLNWIKKIIHQSEMNQILLKTVNLKDAEFAEYLVRKELNTEMNVIGSENIPNSGGAILVSNHPLGGLDGMVLLVEASKRHPSVRVIVNDILSEIPNFEKSFIYINKLGHKGKESLKLIEEAYAGQNLVVVFPAGMCSRKKGNKISDLVWQKSFVSRAKKYSLPVIPMHFEGRNTNRFYRLANFRKKLGIKTNIEMFFLVDELFKQRNKSYKLTVGKPILPAVLQENRHRTDFELAQDIKGFVYELGINPYADFEAYLHNIAHF